MKQVLIIGGGMGGLFTGAILSKEGYKITVLEKNSIIGGGLQCFTRKGKIFETGMHVTGGFSNGGNLQKICNYLGIYDKLNLHHIPDSCMDSIYYHKSNETYIIPSGRDKFKQQLSKYFPEETEGISSYVDEIYRISEEVDLFYLKPSDSKITVHSDNFMKSADELISSYINNPKLQELLAYLNPLYGGEKGHTPAYIHSLINVLYINGASRFKGGSQQLADALKAVICNYGGQVVANSEVTEIKVEARMITDVITANGKHYQADTYISSIHPLELIKIIPSGAFPKAFIKRLQEIPNSYSAFTLFLDLKKSEVPYIEHTCYYMEDYGEIWTQNECREDRWPLGFMYMTPPEANQGKFAERLLVHCIMEYSEVEKWNDTFVGKRGVEYEEWKQSRIDKILDKLENVLPGIKNKINSVYAASPLTIRDYYHTHNGAIFGFRKDCQNIMLSQIPIFTKIKNLLLTGQNINLHGMCGVPLTAINTAEAILGTDYIINRINEEN